MNRTHLTLLLCLRIALLGIAALGILAMPKYASAQENITDDEDVDVTDEFCDPEAGDDCEVESVASILDTTNTSTLYTYSATYITLDLLDYGYEAYVEGYVYQDSSLIADGDSYDDGSGAAELDGTISINLTDGPYAYELDTESYLYDGVDYYDILGTEADVTLGIPEITSVSPAYAFVGTSGSLTIGGESLSNPFGGSVVPSVSAVPGTTGGTGLTISGDLGDTGGTASYDATLTATTGPWDIGLSTEFGVTFFSSTSHGLFTVGDPTPSISSVNPSQWTAGKLNFSVTISGSYFGSDPQLTVSGGGATATISSHSDNGSPGGATINANVSVSNACDTADTVAITVTSTGYNGTGFVPAYSGQSDNGGSTATIVPNPAGAPQIMFGGKNVAGTTTTVVVGQQISLTGAVPTQACTAVKNWDWTAPTGTAVGGATATSASGFSLQALPGSGVNPYTFNWVYAGSFTVSTKYTLTNGETSPTSTATFTVKGLTSGKDTATSPYNGKFSIDNLTGCTGIAAGPDLVYGNVSGPQPGCPGTTTGTPGILFTASGSQPGSGKYTFVQLITTDTTKYTSGSGTTTCTTTVGIDTSYPYKGQPTSTTATDAPETPLPSSYTTVNRVFNATMYLLWQSTTTGSIPVTIGYQSWSSNGTGTQSGGRWSASGSGAPNGSFTPASSTQANKGYPVWSGVATRSCN